MQGFFYGAEFATLATSAATHGVPVEASTSPTRLVHIDEGTSTGEVSEVIPSTATQIETTPVTPLVISTDDPFVALSQAVKVGSSLVVTLSSIPISTNHGPDADLSSEEFEDILVDLDDEPVLGRRISEPEEEESMDMCFLSSPFFFFLLSSFFPFFFLHVHFSCLQSLLRG